MPGAAPAQETASEWRLAPGLNVPIHVSGKNQHPDCQTQRPAVQVVELSHHFKTFLLQIIFEDSPGFITNVIFNPPQIH